MFDLWKNASIVKKILFGVVVASIFLTLQLVGLFFSNSRNVSNLESLKNLEAVSTMVENMRELLDASLTSVNQAPDSEEELSDIKFLIEQNQKHLETLFGSLERRFSEYKEHPRLLDDIKKGLTNFQNTYGKLWEVLEDNGEGSAQELPQLMLARQYVAETLDALTKMNLNLRERHKSIVQNLYTYRYRPLLVGFYLTALFLGLTLGSGFVFFRNFSRSILNLKAATNEIAAGNLHHQAPVLSRDELGEVTESFNKMAKSLLESTVSWEYVKSVLESLPDMLFLTNLDGQIIGVNEATLIQMNQKEEDLLGKDIATLFTKDFIAPDAEENLNGASFESDLLRPNASTVPVFCSVGLVSKDRENAETVIYVVKNIEELRSLQEELELKNSDLTEANKELEAFSYSVSHDLRAPLRSVDGFSARLQKMYYSNLDEQGQDYLRRIRESSSKMGQLIDDLLNLSRLGRAELTKRKVNLSSIVNEIIKDAEVEPGRNIEWVVEPDVSVLADAHLMRVALQNLITNAIKFTSKHAQARIEFGQEDKEGERAYFVRDDGAGFDMAYVNKLFVPFQRLHSAGEFPGTGIGLALINRIIHRHGGRVWAEGQVEKGAVFYFTLAN